MFIFVAIAILQIKNAFDKPTVIDFTANDISCHNLDIFCDSNITFSCNSQYNYSLQYSELENIKFFVENKINIINNSNINYDSIGIQKISIYTVEYTKIIFMDFLDIAIIDLFITNLSLSYENALITLKWNKYPISKSNHCIWDYPSLCQSYNNIKMFTEMQNQNEKLKKLCLDGEAYFHYLEEPSIQNIIISKRTMVICVVTIIVVIIIFLISLYFVALWKYNKNLLHQPSIKENDTNSFSSSTSIDILLGNRPPRNSSTKKNVNSIENEKSVGDNNRENQNIDVTSATNGVDNMDNDSENNKENINQIEDLNDQMNVKQEKESKNSVSENEDSDSNDQNHAKNKDADSKDHSHIGNEDIDSNDQKHAKNEDADLNDQSHTENEDSNSNDQSHTENEDANLNDQKHAENEDADLNDQSHTENEDADLNDQSHTENEESNLNDQKHVEKKDADSNDDSHTENEKNYQNDNIDDNKNGICCYDNDDNNNNLNDLSGNINMKEVNNDDTILNDQNEKSQNERKCSNNVFVLFLKHLFEFGNSAGSIITEAFELLRTFQRLSGTRTFSIHFSKDCLKMFSWASSFFELIMSNFYIGTFSEFELFYLINYVIPILIITFVVSFMCNKVYYIPFIFCGVCFTLGFGFAYVKYDRKTSTALIVVFLIVFILVIIVLIWCRAGLMELIGISFQTSDSYDSPCFFPFSFAISNTLLIVSIMLIPFFLNNSYFLGSYFFVCLILIIIGIIIDLILMRFFEIDMIYELFASNITYLFSNFISLLFVPSTDHFVAVIRNDYKNNANCIFGYLILSLLVPLTLMITMYYMEDPAINDKYKEDFYLIEFIDFGRQIAYAFSAAFDEPWACIAFEIAWILFFSIVKPYKCISQYVLRGGSSFIVILGNVIALICKYGKIDFLSFEISISLACVACIPAVLSFYFYFATEFEIEDDKKIENKKSITEGISGVITIEFYVISPIAWFFYGIFVPLMMDYFNNIYDQYHSI